MKVPYFLQKHNLNGSGNVESTGGYSLRIKYAGTVEFEELIQRVTSLTSETTKGEVMQVMDALLKILSDDLAAGRIVNFGPIGLMLTLQGSVPDINSGYDPAKHSLKIHARVNRKFTEALIRNVSLERVEANDTSPLLRSFLNTSQQLTQNLKPHDLAQLRGKNLKVGASEEEGVFLVSTADSQAYKVTDLAVNSINRIIFKTPETLPNGSYKILVRSKSSGKLKEGSLADEIKVAA